MFKQLHYSDICIAFRLFHPSYRNVYYHKQTKNTWARDDPALVLLQCTFLASKISAVPSSSILVKHNHNTAFATRQSQERYGAPSMPTIPS